MAHWANAFYGNFRDLYNVDRDALEKNWKYHGHLQDVEDRQYGVHSLNIPIPAYTNRCICGHYIKTNCVVSDGTHAVVVGTTCVDKFMPIPKKQMDDLHKERVLARRTCRKFITRHLKKVKRNRDRMLACADKNVHFGKYKKQTWKDVPDSYLRWCVDKDISFDPVLTEYIKYRLRM